MNNATISKPAQYMLNAIIKASNENNPFVINDNVEWNNPVFMELVNAGLVEVTDGFIKAK